MRYLLNDTETVGLNPPGLPASGVVEVAWAEIDPNTLAITNEFVSRVNPGCPIDPRASEVHGIYDIDVMDAPSLGDVFAVDGPTISIGHNCVTGDHEVLTKEGWVAFENLQGSHVEAAVWGEGKIHFESAPIIREPHVGNMLSYDSQFHCGVYTEDHSMVYTRTSHLLAGGSPVWQKTSVAKYAAYSPNSVAIPSAGKYEPEISLEFSTVEIQLIEAARADAHVTHNQVRWALSKPRKIARLKYLLGVAGLPFSEHARDAKATRIALLACPFRDRLVALIGVGAKKRVGSWILQLSFQDREVFLKETEFWDGSKPGAQITVHSQHAEEANWLQIAAVLTNKTSKVYLNRANTRGFSRPDSVLSRVTLRKNPHVKTLYRPSVVQHEGKVYCLTTSTGAFLIRRKGAVWVTGNCSFDNKFLAPHYENLVGSLCTLALARQYVKDSPNHKLGTLADHLGLKKGTAHSALGDVHTTHSLLTYLVEKSGRTLTELIAAARKPKIVHTITFGKYRGQQVSQLPLSYIQWFLGQGDIDQDLRYSLEQALKLRG